MCYSETCFTCHLNYIVICDDWMWHLDHQPQEGEAVGEDFLFIFNGDYVLICPDCMDEMMEEEELLEGVEGA